MVINKRQKYLVDRIQDDLYQEEQITESSKDLAIELYISLEEKPNIETKNPIVGVKCDQGNNKYETLNEYFFDRNKIEFLVFWTLNILPILDILSNVGKLPSSYSDMDFKNFNDNLLDSYVKTLNQLPTENIISTDDIRAIEENCRDLKGAVANYLEGFPSSAFEKIKNYMNFITHLNLEQLTNYVRGDNLELFKIRLGNSNSIYDEKDMFHIPFEKRGLVKTNRYSISGLPCVYLGSTPLICWEEMGKPDLNMTHTSLFLPKKDLTYFNIAIPPMVMAEYFKNKYELQYGVENLTELYEIIRTYLIIWPLIACCSVRVLSPNDSFKPEYIVPQLLLQWIRQSNTYDGICYFSTKIDNYNRNNFSLYKNFAFPVKSTKEQGYCEHLREKFYHITSAVPWQLYLLEKESGMTAIGERYGMVAFTPGFDRLYNTTDFGRLETFLINVMDKERLKNSRK